MEIILHIEGTDIRLKANIGISDDPTICNGACSFIRKVRGGCRCILFQQNLASSNFFGRYRCQECLTQFPIKEEQQNDETVL